MVGTYHSNCQESRLLSSSPKVVSTSACRGQCGGVPFNVNSKFLNFFLIYPAWLCTMLPKARWSCTARPWVLKPQTLLMENRNLCTVQSAPQELSAEIHHGQQLIARRVSLKLGYTMVYRYTAKMASIGVPMGTSFWEKSHIKPWWPA